MLLFASVSQWPEGAIQAVAIELLLGDKGCSIGAKACERELALRVKDMPD